MSPKALSASVSDIGLVVSMVDRVAGSAPGNGSRAAVGEDLVAMTKCRLQSRNSVTQDGNTGARKMRRYASAVYWALARLPVVIPIWFLAIIFPFFGPINSTVGSLLVSFTVYIIPAVAHVITFASPSARENAVERPPSFLGGWAGSYCVNIFVVACSY